MTRDELRTTGILPGVTIDEIIDLAISNIGIDWTIDGCTDFVWGITNLAGAPFFDLRDLTTASDPTLPQDVLYVVPHSDGIKSSTDNVAGDGWTPVFAGASVSDLEAILQPGDVVRVYKDGNTTEDSLDPNGGYAAHSFIVVSVEDGDIQVVDNWNTTGIIQHSLNDITSAFAPSGQFEAAFVSRLDESFAADNFINEIPGNGFGDFSTHSIVDVNKPIAQINLASLDSNSGFRIAEIESDDLRGVSVSSAGDVNGDGFDDIIIGAQSADPDGNTGAGESYVVFGASTGFSSGLSLASLDGTNGFSIVGLDAEDASGLSVSSAGDVNGDGFDDIIIGAPRADPDGITGAGESYVVFGASTGFSANLSLASLDGTNGFRIDGIAVGDASGWSVSSAGDVNGDGLADLLIGAIGADSYGFVDEGEIEIRSGAGESYVVFGASTGFSANLSLASLDGTNGFRIDGIAVGDASGWSVSSAGDVNGDGLADLLIGAIGAGPNGKINSGESYVVFGASTGFSANLSLASLDGANGFRIDGINSFDSSGFSVSSAGDVNGDGLADLLIGAVEAGPNGKFYAGESYVVFGASTGFPASLSLASLDGTNGFSIDGIEAGDDSGRSVSFAGDVNGDGFDDIIIGAPRASPDGQFTAGESYVVFGSDMGFAANVPLASLDGTNGFSIRGISAGDRSGWSVASAGDVNGDGFDDLIIGASGDDPEGTAQSGEAYIVFGFSTTLTPTNSVVFFDNFNRLTSETIGNGWVEIQETQPEDPAFTGSSTFNIVDGQLEVDFNAEGVAPARDSTYQQPYMARTFGEDLGDTGFELSFSFTPGDEERVRHFVGLADTSAGQLVADQADGRLLIPASGIGIELSRSDSDFPLSTINIWRFSGDSDFDYEDREGRADEERVAQVELPFSFENTGTYDVSFTIGTNGDWRIEVSDGTQSEIFTGNTAPLTETLDQVVMSTIEAGHPFFGNQTEIVKFDDLVVSSLNQVPVPAVPDLTAFEWDLSGVDAEGNTFEGDLVFETQDPVQGGFTLGGYFDWVFNGTTPFRVLFDGTFEDDGDIFFENTRLEAPVEGIAAANYWASFNADFTQLIGNSGENNTIPLNWQADRVNPTDPTNSDPIATGTDALIAANTAIPLADLFDWSDPDGFEDVVSFAVRDRTDGSGYLTLDGARQTDDVLYDEQPIGDIDRWAFVAGASGETDEIGFNAIDAAGAFNSPSATSTITAISDETGGAPVIIDPGLITVQEGATGVIHDLVATDDEDTEGEGGGLIFTRAPSPDQLNLSVDLYSGEITFRRNVDGNIVEDANGDGVYELSVTVTDSDGSSDSLDLAIEVVPNNPIEEIVFEYFSRVVAYGRDGNQLGILGSSVRDDTPETLRGWEAEFVFENESGSFRAETYNKVGYAPLLVFRGTVSEGDLTDILADWTENFQTTGVGLEEFNSSANVPGQAASSVGDAPTLREWLLSQDQSISITGHSQGGAQAQIAAWVAASNGRDVAQVVTYNSAGTPLDTGQIADTLPELFAKTVVTHHINASDVVSLTGNMFLPSGTGNSIVLHDTDVPELVDNLLVTFPNLIAAHTGYWVSSELRDLLTPDGQVAVEVLELGLPPNWQDFISPTYSPNASLFGEDADYQNFLNALTVFGNTVGRVLNIAADRLGVGTVTIESSSLTTPIASLNIDEFNFRDFIVNTLVPALSSRGRLTEELAGENGDLIRELLSSATMYFDELGKGAEITVEGNFGMIPFSYGIQSGSPEDELHSMAPGQSVVLSGRPVELFGDRATDFQEEDTLIISDTVVTPAMFDWYLGSAVLTFDLDLDGEVDGEITLEGDYFEGAEFNLEIIGDDTHITVDLNQAPIVRNDGGVGFATDEESAFTTGNVLANDTDEDGDTLSVTGLDLSVTQGSVIDNGDGTFKYDPNGAFDTLRGGQTATDRFFYFVSDDVETVRGEVTVLITGANGAPVARDDTANVLEDGMVSINALANDSDPDGNDTLSVVIAASISGSSVTISDGTLFYTADADIYDLLETGEEITDQISYTIEDDFGEQSSATVDVTITGRADGEVIFGTKKKDNVTGTDGEDLIYAENGKDMVYAGEGADTVFGGNGNDKLFGEGSIDTLHGENGDDWLDGGSGDDFVFGGRGDDTLDGGLGDDELTGGKGDDIFIVRFEQGTDTIQDFEVGSDWIALEGLEVNELDIGQSGDNTTLRANGELLAILIDVAAPSLTADDFFSFV